MTETTTRAMRTCPANPNDGRHDGRLNSSSGRKRGSRHGAGTEQCACGAWRQITPKISDWMAT